MNQCLLYHYGILIRFDVNNSYSYKIINEIIKYKTN